MASLKGGGGLDKASMAKLKAKLAELNREDILFLKRDSSIFRQSSQPCT